MKFSDILTLEQKMEKGDYKASVAKSTKQEKGEFKASSPASSGKSAKQEKGEFKSSSSSGKSEKPEKGNYTTNNQVNTAGGFAAILVGGLNYREGDKSTSTQESILKNAIGGMKVKSFDWNASTESILSFLSANPKIPVFLFSAGCKKAGALSESNNVDVNKIYIIEPFYEAGGETARSVQKAVSNGVPSKNVFVGPGASRGNGIVSGSASSQAKGHWDALVSVGGMVSNKLFK
jgi:hypothetical protein